MEQQYRYFFLRIVIRRFLLMNGHYRWMGTTYTNCKSTKRFDSKRRVEEWHRYFFRSYEYIDNLLHTIIIDVQHR